jgi:subtilisin family serine protease|tara:strand:+ start:275 stop:2197 length:1923 start_codon:yes stop_codon:yes gene_type:complete
MKTTFNPFENLQSHTSSFASDEPQAYEISVNSPDDWQYVHDILMQDGTLEDNIPSRSCDCVSDMCCSPTRSVYLLSDDEVAQLINHEKVNWIRKSPLFNQDVVEQRKLTQELFPDAHTNRYKFNIESVRNDSDTTLSSDTLDYTQWGLLRAQQASNAFVGVGTTSLSSDVQFSLTGKHVDVVIMDTGVRWDHPEFLSPEYTSVPVGVATTSVSRVRDILIHGALEYGIDWASEGLVAPGTGTLADYTEEGALNSATFGGSWHGSHVAGTAAGNNFGAAFEANIWSIACIDRADLGFADPADGFDYIKVWHKNKPINPETGRRNPTVVNGSWGFREFVNFNSSYNASFRGVTYSSVNIEADTTFLPAVYWMQTNGSWYEFNSTFAAPQTTTDEIFNDSDCADISFVFSAGNSGSGNGKLDVPNGIDYDNAFSNATFAFGTGGVADRGLGVSSLNYNRSGTPNIAHEGLPDAPIIVGALDADIETTAGFSSERKASFSNNGPRVDVWSAGQAILSPWSSGFDDPRNNTFHNQYLQGTSMASPNATGVLALYLQANPSADRTQVRNWLLTKGTIGVGTYFRDTYTHEANGPSVGAGTSVDYWANDFEPRDAPHRVLYNPFANNLQPNISGDISITGDISIKQL